MNPNNQNPAGNGAPEGLRSLEPAPVQPRQPADLRGLMRFAMEAQGQNEPAQVSPLSNDAEETPLHLLGECGALMQKRSIHLGKHLHSPDELRAITPKKILQFLAAARRRAFLEQALQSMVIDVREVLGLSLTILRDKDKIGSLAGKKEVSSEVKNAFDNLSDLTEDIDGSDAFCKAGGFDIFELLYNVSNPELWVMTNNLLAAACQNYSDAQAQALDRGLLKTLLDKLQDPETNHKEKFIYALSSCVRGHSASGRALLALGGVEALAPCLRIEEQPLQTKAACLLNHLTRTYPDAKDKLKELNLPQILASVIDKNVGESTEHLLNLLRSYVDNKEPDIIEQCKNADPPLQIAIRNVLDSPTVRNNKEMYEEIIEYGVEVLSFVFGEGRPLCDCSEEADR